MSRIVTDDGLHWEHFVVSSADAERTKDGELRVRLLRPLKRVKAIRLVYAELPKTTRTLDLMLDVGTQAGRIVTQQVARSARSNENDSQQRQAFGRIFVQDYEATDFFETAALAFTTGTVPRFLYENDSLRYMRFEFRPALSSMQLLNIKLYSALLDENGQQSIYSPDLFVVTVGKDLIDRGTVLLSSDNVAQTMPLVLQASDTLIRRSSTAEYADYLEQVSDFLTVKDYTQIQPSDPLGIEGYRVLVGFYPSTQNYLLPVALAVYTAAENAPDARLTIQDGSPVKLDSIGIVTSPLVYSIQSMPAAMEKFLFEASLTTLGRIHPFQWITVDDALDTIGKPLFPYAFRVEDYPASTEAARAVESSVQSGAIGRVILQVDPAVGSIVPLTATTDFQRAVRRCNMKYLLRTTSVRTEPQTRAVHGVLNSSLRARQLNFYDVTEVFDVDPAMRIRFEEYYTATTGSALGPSTLLFAVEFNRNVNPSSDPESYRVGGAPVSLVPFKKRYRIDGGNGFSVDLNADNIMAASFPVTLTFEAEIEQQ